MRQLNESHIFSKLEYTKSEIGDEPRDAKANLESQKSFLSRLSDAIMKKENLSHSVETIPKGKSVPVLSDLSLTSYQKVALDY